VTRDEALEEIKQLSEGKKSAPVSQQEVLCPEMKAAARVLSLAFDRIRKHDPLYGRRRHTGGLAPPPGLVPPA